MPLIRRKRKIRSLTDYKKMLDTGTKFNVNGKIITETVDFSVSKFNSLANNIISENRNLSFDIPQETIDFLFKSKNKFFTHCDFIETFKTSKHYNRNIKPYREEYDNDLIYFGFFDFNDIDDVSKFNKVCYIIDDNDEELLQACNDYFFEAITDDNISGYSSDPEYDEENGFHIILLDEKISPDCYKIILQHEISHYLQDI